MIGWRLAAVLFGVLAATGAAWAQDARAPQTETVARPPDWLSQVLLSANTASTKAKDPCAFGKRNPYAGRYSNHWDDKCTGPH